jgi:hypothetical protein
LAAKIKCLAESNRTHTDSKATNKRLHPGHPPPPPVVQIGAASAPINSRRKAQPRSPPKQQHEFYDGMTHGATK